MSPGGRTPYSLRRMPELPPSSAAVTTAVIPQSFGRCRRSPLKTTGSPVPPPSATTRESTRSCPVPSPSLGITRSITSSTTCSATPPAACAPPPTPRRQSREVELGKTPHAVRHCELGLQQDVEDARAPILQPELACQRRPPEVDVGKQDAGPGSLGEGTGQVDRGRRLAVSRPGTRDRHHMEVGVPAHRFDGVAEDPVPLSLERGRPEETREALVQRDPPRRRGGQRRGVPARGTLHGQTLRSRPRLTRRPATASRPVARFRARSGQKRGRRAPSRAGPTPPPA